LIESDILLLDISKNEEYVWTTTFEPPPPPSPSTTVPSPSSPSSPPPTSQYLPPTPTSTSFTPAAMTGAILGSLFGGILLSLGCFFLYKRNKDRKKQTNIVQIPGSDDRGRMLISTERNIHNHGQGAMLTNPAINSMQIPRNESTTNHEPTIIPAPVVYRNYNPGQ
jgi:hypothetical protein